MTRRGARITHDEIRRLIKAVQSCGLPVGEVIFDGDRVRVVIGGESGERRAGNVDKDDPDDDQLIREPQL